MYNYKYITTITLPLNRQSFIFHSSNLDELCEALNHFYLQHSGLDTMFNRDKLQNYISGRTKQPHYMKNVKISRMKKYNEK